MKNIASFAVGGISGILLAAAAFNFWSGISGNEGFYGLSVFVFFSTWFLTWAFIYAGIKAFWRRRELQIKTMSTDESSRND